MSGYGWKWNENMKIIPENVRVEDNCIIIEETHNFNIEQILECGQCFHFEKIRENEYVIAAKQHLLHIRKEGRKAIFYNTDEETFRKVWWDYFDLDRDYGEIIRIILDSEKAYLDRQGSRESCLKKAVKEKEGIRILNQDFFEMLISFIISQNKQIPHIRQIVDVISRRYGRYLGEVEGREFYSFPEASELAKAAEEELRECKVGFRAPYIVDACRKIVSGEILEDDLRASGASGAKKMLMNIKGVGEKIADCVLVFGLGERAAFPVDVWIRRIMNDIYFDKEASIEEISALAKEIFGQYGGYAQQYLFYYGRENKLGK